MGHDHQVRARWTAAVPAGVVVVIVSFMAGACGGEPSRPGAEPSEPTVATIATASTSGSQSPSVAASSAAAQRVCLGREGTVPSDIIVGTDGDDRLVGTPGRDIICGNDGNDTIDGRGGKDEIYGGPGDDGIRGGYAVDGGPGDDHVVGGYRIRGGPGDDLLQAGGYPSSSMYGQDGDDILLAGVKGYSPWLDGGTGNDVMLGAVITVLGNDLIGGDGKDVAVALNLSSGIRANADRIDLDGKRRITMGLTSACSITVPRDEPSSRRRGTASCKLPWPQQLSGLNQILPLSITMDQAGKLTLSADLHDALRQLSGARWRDLAKSQASITADTCICDPLVPMGQPPPAVNAPIDWSL